MFTPRFDGDDRDGRLGQRSPMFENPSADKFGPPKLADPDRDDRKTKRRLMRFAVGLVVVAAAHWFHAPTRPRGWATLFSALVLFSWEAFELVMKRHAAADDEEKDPYSPPTHITR